MRMSRRSSKKVKTAGVAEPMVAITIRLPKSVVAEYDSRAIGGLTRSDMMRAAIEKGVGRLPTPQVVPPVNKEQVVEMRVVAADLHKLIRMLELARSAALEEALTAASSSSATLVNVLRLAKSDDEEAIARAQEALSSALTAATRLNQAVHEQFGPHMAADPDTLDRLYDTVRRLQGVCMVVQRGLLGG